MYAAVQQSNLVYTELDCVGVVRGARELFSAWREFKRA
jgi:hypothetical protein